MPLAVLGSVLVVPGLAGGVGIAPHALDAWGLADHVAHSAAGRLPSSVRLSHADQLVLRRPRASRSRAGCSEAREFGDRQIGIIERLLWLADTAR